MRRLRPFLAPAFLLGLCILAYGLWIPRMGFYWDDFPILWIGETFGQAGLARYFSTVRPVWGLLYRLSIPLIGAQPLVWQALAVALRWLTGLLFWLLLRAVWPKRGSFAVWAAAIFVLYPGFSQQFISVVYSHFFIVLSAFLASLLLSLQALRRPERFLPYTLAAWALGLFNLLCLEYFFFLELLRPLLFFIVLRQDHPWKRALGQALTRWIPYAASLLGVMIWRTFFFQSGLYQPLFMQRLRANPLDAVLYLLGRIGGDMLLTGAQAWGNAFRLPTPEELTPNLMRIYWAVVAAGILACLAYAVLDELFRRGEESLKRAWFPAPLLTGLFALAIAGAPFWLTELPLRLFFHYDRFNLAFMAGAALCGAGLLHLFPLPGRASRWLAALPLAAALGFSAGYHYQQAIVYVRDWNVQQRLMTQLAWRIPALQPGTALFANEQPVAHYSDNSLSAPLNWVFANGNTSQQMTTILYYPTVRLGLDLPALEKDQPLYTDYLAAEFSGNTSQAVVFYFNPPGCVRILDPQVEVDNYTLPRYVRRSLGIASTAPILSEGQPNLPAALFGRQN
ncbi:MAG: hypothetical protein HY835_10900 [Anaerolineae bacterium]|nr:hypothetical protein [Anaerolineae bacterium]